VRASDLSLTSHYFHPQDTDSILTACAYPSLRECLRSDSDAAELESLMEDKFSPTHQAGKLRDEGWYTAALFRSAKSYFLSGKFDPEVRRMRSVPRRVQAKLEAAHYGQDVALNSAVFRTRSLRPTLGLEIAVLEESRKISHALNFKMAAVVSPSVAAVQDRRRHLLPFQDPVHTRPLP
jgi:hypothetical protein